MKYIIDISLAEDSKVVKTIGSTYYMSNGKCDTVTFSARGISIEAERGKAYTEDDIFNNVQNSLYNQMLKALLYHYAYFLRNRLFHGHSLLKCPIFNRQADMMGVGVTVSTVETLVAEMINNFGRL